MVGAVLSRYGRRVVDRKRDDGSPHHDGPERTLDRALAAAGAGRRVAQYRRFFPAFGFQAQQVERTGCDAPAAAGAACGINLGQQVTVKDGHARGVSLESAGPGFGRLTLPALDKKLNGPQAPRTPCRGLCGPLS